MASSPHFIWIYSAWTQTKRVSLPSHVYYSFPLKAHYFTAGCVRGGPSLWTLCRGCINQTSHSGEGSTHWHGTAHSTLEDKRENTQPKLSLWNVYSFWRLRLLIIFPTITPHLFKDSLKDGQCVLSILQLCLTCISVSVSCVNIVVLFFFFSTVDNKILAWGNGTSGQ